MDEVLACTFPLVSSARRGLLYFAPLLCDGPFFKKKCLFLGACVVAFEEARRS